MSAPVNNQFWRLREVSGRRRKFKNARALQNACDNYFQWVEDTPVLVERTGLFKGVPFRYVERFPRVMHISAMCDHIGIVESTWREWRKTRKDLSEVIMRAEEIIWEQKFQYAAIGVFNPNLIAMELGLKNKLQVSNSSVESLEEFLEGLEPDTVEEVLPLEDCSKSG